MKTAVINLKDIKSEEWFMIGYALGFNDKEISEIFEYGEYANLILEIDENLNIVSGKINRFKDLEKPEQPQAFYKGPTRWYPGWNENKLRYE